MAAYYISLVRCPLIRQSGLEAFLMLAGICAGARAHLSDPRAVHRRGHCRVCLPGGGDRIFRSGGAKDPVLQRGVDFRDRSGRLFLHRPSPVRRDLHEGGGIGPATSFLYSGPAINVLAIVLTARVSGWKLGLAGAIGAVGFAFIIGLLMHFIYLKEEKARVANNLFLPEEGAKARPLWKETIVYGHAGSHPHFRRLGKTGPTRGILDGGLGGEVVYHGRPPRTPGPGTLVMVQQGGG